MLKAQYKRMRTRQKRSYYSKGDRHHTFERVAAVVKIKLFIVYAGAGTGPRRPRFCAANAAAAAAETGEAGATDAIERRHGNGIHRRVQRQIGHVIGVDE